MKNTVSTDYIKYCINRKDFDLSVAYKALIGVNCLNSFSSERKKKLSLKLEKRVSQAIQIYGLNDNNCFDFFQAKIFLINLESELP